MEEVKYTFVLSNIKGDSLTFGYDHKENSFLLTDQIQG